VIPRASLTTETSIYSGDLFKTAEDIATNLVFVRAFKDRDDPESVSDYPEEVRAFYSDRAEYESLSSDE